MKQEKEGKWIKIAAICGIIIFVLSIIGIVVSFFIQENLVFASYYSLIQGILYNLAVIGFISGFYFIGKRYNKNFLKVISIISIIFVIVCFLVNILYVSPESQRVAIKVRTIILNHLTSLGITPEQFNNLSESQTLEIIGQIIPQIMPIITPLLILLFIYLIFYVIISILFGIGLIGLRDRIKHSKAAGILEIVGAATSFLLLGIFVSFFAFIFEIIILFKESEK